MSFTPIIFNQTPNFDYFNQTSPTFPMFKNFNFMVNTSFITAPFNLNHNTITNNINFTPTNYSYFQTNTSTFNDPIYKSKINYKDITSSFDTNYNKIKYNKKSKREITYDAKVLKETWKNKKPHLTNEFYNKVIDISKKLNCDPNELMAVMNSESGIKHTAINKKSGATGLIQFMPNTAKSLGTSTSALKNMTAVEQLDYVEKYLKRQKAAAGFSKDDYLSAGELYALIFLPGRANREVLTTNNEKYYKYNKGLDRNKDGKITITELDTRVKTDFMA